jgi:glycosyltransferase involved in cell wall biosynthesis
MLVFLTYLIRMLTYLIGWNRIIRLDIHHSDTTGTGASIVIPVRNEAQHLGLLLSDLQGQSFPGDRFEIIVVDDHSTDQTKELVQSQTAGNPAIRLLELGEGEYGKKSAIRKGVSAARHEVIVSTDGDCRVPSEWLGRMMGALGGEGIRMVSGPVMISPDKTGFHAMQSLEFFSLTGVTAGSAGWGSPILCNAANLAYRREDFFRFLESGDPGTASGDDMFLMLWLKKKYPGSIRHITSAGAVIRTYPAGSPMAFFMQRLRWASKNRFYQDLHINSTAILIFLVHACLLGLAVGSLLSARWIVLFVTGLTIKSFMDIIFLNSVLKYYGKRSLLCWFLPLELIYFVYVSGVGIASQLVPYSWKGRNIQP